MVVAKITMSKNQCFCFCFCFLKTAFLQNVSNGLLYCQLGKG